jgi:protein kinase-like protein
VDGIMTLRGGRFVLMQPIGEGAQGRTFDGVDKREGRAVAIKRFDVRGATSWKDVELAEREARVLQSLSHPMLPSYIDHFEEDGALYLVMEKIEGESLATIRGRGAPFGEGDVVRLLHDAAEALDYLHGRAPPVIHRDLKPGNVIRRPDGSFAFVDFGAVRDKLRPKGGSTVVGTFGYMAPEQMQGRALPASDVYSIGATALSMLTGCEPEELPHRGLAIDVRRALANRPARRHRGLIEILERMLDPDPDRRPSRITPLLRRLDDEPRLGLDPRADTRAERYSRHVERRAKRHARREARRAQRAALRMSQWSAPRAHPFPQPARLLFALLFTIAIVAVAIATEVVVPLVLRVLSLFFARRALSTAADAVRSAGEAAIEEMSRSRHWFLDEEVVPLAEQPPPTADPPPPRVDSQAQTRIRVVGGAEGEALREDEPFSGEDAQREESEAGPIRGRSQR